MKVPALGLLVLCTVLWPEPAVGARILAYLPLYSRSRNIFFHPILMTLAKAGHTIYSHTPVSLVGEKPDNYIEFPIDTVTDRLKEANFTEDILPPMDMPVWKCVDFVHTLLPKIYYDCKYSRFVWINLLNENVNKHDEIDLIITEFFAGQEFMLFAGNVYNAPVIALQSHSTFSITNKVFGNDLSISYLPDLCTPFSNKMTFYERTLNFLYIYRSLFYIYDTYYIPTANYFTRRMFGPGPPVRDLIDNISLVFVNDHPMVDYAQPRSPNIIPVGGIHLGKLGNLSESLKAYLDEAKEGFIYFSLGNVIPDDHRPWEYFYTFLSVFETLKLKVLWRTNRTITRTPTNVKVVSYAPQLEVLAHPNCKLFITHGGLMSLQETIYYGVPVVSMPHYGDQFRNSKFYEEQGMGIMLDPKELRVDELTTSIITAIYNSKYARNAKRLSRLFKDQPMTPQETVVYWTDYVLKHGGARLKPSTSQLHWYELALIDVISFILTAVVCVSVLYYHLIRVVIPFWRSIRRSETNTTPPRKPPFPTPRRPLRPARKEKKTLKMLIVEETHEFLKYLGFRMNRKIWSHLICLYLVQTFVAIPVTVIYIYKYCRKKWLERRHTE